MKHLNNSFGFDIQKIKSKYAAESENHSHPYYELLYIKTGNFTYFIEDTIINIPSNSIVLVNKDTLHKAIISNQSKVSYYIIKFYASFLEKQFSDICNDLFMFKQYTLANNDSYMMELLFSKIHKEYTEEHPERELLLNYQLSEIITFLSRLIQKNAIPIQEEPSISLIEEIVFYINENVITSPDVELSLNAISKKFLMSPSCFSRFFKKHIGIGFKEYILSVKILHAKQLIGTTDLPLTQIAYLSGFHDSNYFSTVFKRLESSSPSDYAKFIKKQS